VSGEEVRQLQLVLKSGGYFNPEPTGYFGSLTKAALIAFQSANGIEPAGVVGPKTRILLNAP
jgi:peptidoglycan hydrolase-like protein with peptidoglycan-binding domain